MDSTIDVLHVDDDESMGDLVATYLERADDRVAVTTTTNAADALEHLGEPPPAVDCVVSDYEMPDMDGIEFLDAVRERYPELPFVLFTGKGSEEVASDAISAGATDYLQKGGGSEQYTVLTNRVLNAVDRRRTETALQQTDSLLSTLFDALPVGVLAEDGDRNVIAVNDRYLDLLQVDGDPSSLLGSDADQLVQAVGDRIVEPENFVERTKHLVDAAKPVSKEEVVFHDGRRLARTHVPFELRDGVGYLWVYDDITDEDDE